MASRTWVKVFCDKWLDGTIRTESPTLRATFVDVLVLAGSGRFGDTGQIKLADRIGLSDPQIAGILRLELESWQICKAKLIETERIKVDDFNVISVCNWQKYQSEYERVKPYRSKSTTKSHTPDNNLGQRKGRGGIEEGGTIGGELRGGYGDRDGDGDREENRREKKKRGAPSSAPSGVSRYTKGKFGHAVKR